MFTGIIQAKGTVVAARAHAQEKRLGIEIAGLPAPVPGIGDSLSVNGVCLTVTGIRKTNFSFDVSSETLNRSLIDSWGSGDVVNIEKALTLTTPLGGHLVSGHVDGIGTVTDLHASGLCQRMRVSIDNNLGMFIACKGSVAIDGISLTVNQVKDSRDMTVFDMMLVPHTLQQTTLGTLAVGDSVHVEIDQIARYVQRLGQFASDQAKLAED